MKPEQIVAILGSIALLAAFYFGADFRILVALWIVAGASGLGFLVWRMRQRKQGRAALAALAKQHGWEHLPSDPDRAARLTAFPPLARAGAVAADVVAGTFHGVPFEAWTQQHSVHTNRGDRISHFAVVVVPMPARAPGLRIQPERLGHKLVDAVGGQDIDFESDAFSRRFRVQCDDRRFAEAALPPATRDALLARNDGWSWHWRDTTLVLWRPDPLKAEQILPALELVHAFGTQLPRGLQAAQVPA